MNTLALQSTERESPLAGSGARVRAALSTDREFVMSLVPRLVATGLPPWRDPRKMLAAYIEVVGSILRPQGVQSRPEGVQSRPQEAQGHAPRSDAALLIAEDAGEPLGFILLVAATDCYTHERHGHVVQIVVAVDSVEGAIQLLAAAAKDWVMARGSRLLTPDQFLDSHPASAVCAHRKSVLSGQTSSRSDVSA